MKCKINNDVQTLKMAFNLKIGTLNDLISNSRMWAAADDTFIF